MYSVTDARAPRADATRCEGIFTCYRHSAVFRSDENMWSTRVCVHILVSIHTWLCCGVGATSSGLHDYVTDSLWLVQLTHNVL